MEGLSDVVGSLISAQVAGKVVGEVADEVSSDYFRLSTGIYDAATVGEVQARIGNSIVRTLTLNRSSVHPVDYSRARSYASKSQLCMFIGPKTWLTPGFTHRVSMTLVRPRRVARFVTERLGTLKTSDSKGTEPAFFIYPHITPTQISPPLTADDESVGRSVSSIGLPSDVGNAFSGVSSMSLAVAEWIIDPRQVGRRETKASAR